jgi:hypothetical protein
MASVLTGIYVTSGARLHELLDEVKDDSDPRYRQIETLEALIEKYDHEHYKLPDASPVEVLRFLMEQHGLNQGDLPEIGLWKILSLGVQPLVPVAVNPHGRCRRLLHRRAGFPAPWS